jgi:hypothetical protein
MKCIQCERTSEQVPLIRLEYKGSEYSICPEHLPILIHQPAKLEGKLPQAGEWHSGENHHGH